MNTDHNPIAELITRIQNKWTKEASPFPEYKVVRWLIKPEQARLYEGFLRLESTEYGTIPEVLITMLTPFENKETYVSALMHEWDKAYNEDVNTQKKLEEKGKARWTPDSMIENIRGNNHNNSHNKYDEFNIDGLLKMLSHFKQTMIGDDMGLVIALFPHSIQDMGAMNLWLNQLVKMPFPENIRFMIFDHAGENYFKYALKNNPDKIKTLICELDLDGAISKIAKMGNPNSPEVKLRECILEMGKGVQSKNKHHVHIWGQKALDATQKSGSASMYATAHILYAGMLFNFRQYEKIDLLLEDGLPIAEKGLQTEEAASRPLVVQYYGFKAASKQLQGRYRDALFAYEQQASKAVEFHLTGLALTPLRQAYDLSKKHQPERYDELITKAFAVGKSLEKEEQLNSSFPVIALDYLQWLEMKRMTEKTLSTELEMIQLLGPDWKELAKGISKKAVIESQHSLIPS
jgi:hypothetical protein